MSEANDFDWLNDLPLKPGPPDLRMGLRKVKPERWLLVDALTESELNLKAELLQDHPESIQLLAGAEGAAGELLAETERFLGAEASGLDGLEALRRGALLTPEDQCLIARVDGEWRLVAGSLVFENHWQLAPKLGGTLSEIHGPTEGYEEILAAKVRSFFDNLNIGRLVGRRNWFIHDDNEYRQSGANVPRAIDDPAKVADLFVRSEWETLRKLPTSAAIVFTIKTQIAPMTELKRRPDVGTKLAEFLQTASSRSLRLKDAAGRSGAIVNYLKH